VTRVGVEAHAHPLDEPNEERVRFDDGERHATRAQGATAVASTSCEKK
jgi:hypothetical protein